MGGVGGSQAASQCVTPLEDIMPSTIMTSLGQHLEFVEDPMLLESGMITEQRTRRVKLSLTTQCRPTDRMKVKPIEASRQGYD
jgi:hypothetical protein